MPRCVKTVEHRHAVELYFTDEEMRAICKAASDQSKMRLQWMMDVLASAIERETSPECEHGVERGTYCAECGLASGEYRRENWG